MKKRICIINFASIHDWRMSRELEIIAKEYDITIIAKQELFEEREGVEWKFIESTATPISKLWDRVMMVLGKLMPYFYDLWFWRRRRYRDALNAALETEADVYQANDWAALAIAVEAAQRRNVKSVFDAHEYWSLETENQTMWRLFFSPLIRHVEKRYIPRVDAFVTVSPPIVQRYAQEYGVKPVLIVNAPDTISLPAFKPTNPNHIRLVNHGTAVRDRQLEKMIEALTHADERLTLDFILLPVDDKYIEELKTLAERIVPGRVKFHAPIPKSEILARIAEYDVGIYIMAPISYNNHMALPNRFFDFIVSGLAVCVGPSPAMMEIVEQHGLGIVTPSFEAKDIAVALNRLTPEDIDRMKQASREAGKALNARTENQKWITLYRELLDSHA